jgi:hypothetical protein
MVSVNILAIQTFRSETRNTGAMRKVRSSWTSGGNGTQMAESADTWTKAISLVWPGSQTGCDMCNHDKTLIQDLDSADMNVLLKILWQPKFYGGRNSTCHCHYS